MVEMVGPTFPATQGITMEDILVDLVALVVEEEGSLPTIMVVALTVLTPLVEEAAAMEEETPMVDLTFTDQILEGSLP